MAEIIASSHYELIHHLTERDEPVGPRRGPNRRTQEKKEWYCVRTYLCTLANHSLLHYPICISKTAPPKPDFVVSEGGVGTYGIEVTEATTGDWQRELTITEESDHAELIGTGWDGDTPEIETAGLIQSAIRAKKQKLAQYDVPKMTYPNAIC
jgi:hypothetical protein